MIHPTIPSITVCYVSFQQQFQHFVYYIICMRTLGTDGTLNLYKSFTCPIRPHHFKQTKKCTLNNALYKAIRTLLLYIGIKRP